MLHVLGFGYFRHYNIICLHETHDFVSFLGILCWCFHQNDSLYAGKEVAGQKISSCKPHVDKQTQYEQCEKKNFHANTFLRQFNKNLYFCTCNFINEMTSYNENRAIIFFTKLETFHLGLRIYLREKEIWHVQEKRCRLSTQFVTITYFKET